MVHIHLNTLAEAPAERSWILRIDKDDKGTMSVPFLSVSIECKAHRAQWTAPAQASGASKAACR